MVTCEIRTSAAGSVTPASMCRTPLPVQSHRRRQSTNAVRIAQHLAASACQMLRDPGRTGPAAVAQTWHPAHLPAAGSESAGEVELTLIFHSSQARSAILRLTLELLVQE